MKEAALKESLDLVEVKYGVWFPRKVLKDLLPTVEITLFFAKLYRFSPSETGRLLSTVHSTTLVQALTAEGVAHSSELQDFVVELGYEYLINSGDIVFLDVPPEGEVLPELWKMCEVDIAASIQEVADKLTDVLGLLPGKQGEMVFKSLMTVNAKRPLLGDYKAAIHHQPQKRNLLILDVSGSMSEPTVGTIIGDTVALGYMANASLAIVSNTTTVWGPGEYDVESVLKVAEYAGTHYETLAALLDEEWGVVITIADYDSSWSAKEAIAQCTGHIDLLLDISLVNQPTYLAEVVGQLADEVRPLLVASQDLTSGRW